MVRELLRFGDCTLDIAARELRRGGERVELPPTVFDCIAYLVAHRDRAVGRDELVAAVWARTAISDTMLGKAILAARRAIGDDAERQALLRTVPRFGYHWVGAVEAAPAPLAPAVSGLAVPAAERVSSPASVDSPSMDSLPADSPALADPPIPEDPLPAQATDVPSRPPQKLDGHRKRLRTRLALKLLLPLAVAAVAAALLLPALWPGTPEPRPGLDIAVAPLPEGSAAVLPAEVTADAADSWLRLGAMDLIAARLRNAGLPVVSSDSVVRLAPEGVSAEAAAASLRRAVDVQHLVQPALRRSGAQWIARAELIAPDGSRRPVQASAANAVAAADAVAEQLLALLGRGTAGIAPPADLPLAELLQRVDAARLSDQPEQARALIAAASPAQRREPELRLREIQADLRAGDFKSAGQRIDALLADVPEETDAVMRGRALESRCVLLSRSGEMAAALTACDQAIALLETRNQPLALGRAYNHRGIIHARELRAEAAMADFSRSRVVLGTVGDPLLLAMVDGNESVFAMEQGRPADALAGLQRAGLHFQRFGMLSEAAVLVVNQVQAQLALLQPLEALKASEQGWALRARFGDPALRQRFSYERAEALAANGRLAEARRLFDEVLHGPDALADSSEVALARLGLARLELDAGQPAAAALLAGQALPRLEPAEFALQRALAWLMLLRGEQRQGQLEVAQAQLVQFRAWAQGAAKAEARVVAAVAEAEQAAARQDQAGALKLQAQARQLATGLSRPDVRALAARSEAALLLDSGDLRGAAVRIGELARHADTDYDAALLQWRLYRALGQDAAAAGVMGTLRRLAGERPLPQPEAPLAQAGDAGN
jgi:DNA-binding winged helix-turn-helix (wHTH) protein